MGFAIRNTTHEVGGLTQWDGVPAGHGCNGTLVRAQMPVDMTPSVYTASYSAWPRPDPGLGDTLAADGAPSHAPIASNW